MYGLDLFSGIGGIGAALRPWVRTVAYCECDKYAQAVLLSRMAEGKLDFAPIWDDIRTLDGTQFKGSVDIIFGGFPCQDISCAGRKVGLGGERSGLFFEIVRLAQEIRPTFIFLENVPAIRTRGLDTVGRQLADIGYDCRWGPLSAFDMGAPHKRERWFCLARNTDRNGKPRRTVDAEVAKLCSDVSNTEGWTAGLGESREEQSTPVADAEGLRWGEGRAKREECTAELSSWKSGGTFPGAWESDAGILRVAHGIPRRMDRLRCLGNAVVPAQAREAFRRLMGL